MQSLHYESDVLVTATIIDGITGAAITGATVSYELLRSNYNSTGINGTLPEVGGGVYRNVIDSTITAGLRLEEKYWIRLDVASGSNTVVSWTPAICKRYEVN